VISVRILLINKFFHPGAGAETSFFATRALLQERGHDVIDFAMAQAQNAPSPYADYFAPERSYSADVALPTRVIDAAASVYSTSARTALSRLLDDHPPAIAHLHNIYHQLTLSIVDELSARRIPIVLTLHDWKVACPAYTLYTQGAPCRRCPSSGVHNAIRHRCVKGSLAGSAIAALEARVARQRKSYDKVDRFIAPSRFAIEVARLGGIDGRKVAHVPNFLPAAELRDRGGDGPTRPRVLFVGRLEETKGVRDLLTAFAQVRGDAELRFVGGGPLENEVAAAVAADPRITFAGRLPRHEVVEEYRQARCVVMPSVWEDNGPLVILEAQAMKKPMIVTDRGGLPEFVEDGQDGIVVPAASPAALARAITHLTSDEEDARERGLRARRRVLKENSEAVHYQRLEAVYRAAIDEAAV
jgi:glycosyltransferase involved in cell wall biosynthesis